MNKFKLFCLLLLVITSYKGYGQTNPADAPTKQDALDFINKVLTAYPPLQYTDDMSQKIIAHMTATMDGCKLILTSNWNSPPSPNLGFSSDCTSYTTTVDIIDLSSVYYTDGHAFKSNANGDIVNIYHNEVRKANGKIKWSTSDPKYYPGGDNHHIATGIAIDNVINGAREQAERDPAYINNHYDDRIFKAMLFLVKACGGGKMKVDSNDKF